MIGLRGGMAVILGLVEVVPMGVRYRRIDRSLLAAGHSQTETSLAMIRTNRACDAHDFRRRVQRVRGLQSIQQ